MNKQKNLEKLIFDIFDKEIEGTDIYNHDGSMWLIFTEERKWVVEFTKEKTLWYNYKHFNDILILFGMESSDGAEYIKKWYEDKFIFNQGVKEIDDSKLDRPFFVEDVIDNGVKNSQSFDGESLKLVNKIIDDGVKHTEWAADLSESIEDTIQNGIKEVDYYDGSAEVLVNDAIEKGIKETRGWAFTMRQISVEDTIENGVKDTEGIDFNEDIDDVIENGVKYMMSGSEFKNNQVEDIIKYSEKL